jgi:shikimate 5-dehydrogenase
MLLWQGAVGYELWTGAKFPVEEFRAFKAGLK